MATTMEDWINHKLIMAAFASLEYLKRARVLARMFGRDATTTAKHLAALEREINPYRNATETWTQALADRLLSKAELTFISFIPGLTTAYMLLNDELDALRNGLMELDAAMADTRKKLQVMKGLQISSEPVREKLEMDLRLAQLNFDGCSTTFASRQDEFRAIDKIIIFDSTLTERARAVMISNGPDEVIATSLPPAFPHMQEYTQQLIWYIGLVSSIKTRAYGNIYTIMKKINLAAFKTEWILELYEQLHKLAPAFGYATLQILTEWVDKIPSVKNLELLAKTTLSFPLHPIVDDQPTVLHLAVARVVWTLKAARRRRDHPRLRAAAASLAPAMALLGLEE